MGFESLTGWLSIPAWVVVTGIVGTAVGSFLNVVILRLPPRLHYEGLSLLSGKPAGERPPGILRPGSHCPACKTPIRAWQNLPVISFLLLRGQCRHCGVQIGFRYPLVELLSGLLSAGVVLVLGPTWQGLAGLLLTWVFITLSFIDIDHGQLPDLIVLPGLWLGLGASLVPVFVVPADAIVGAAAGYLVLWSVYQGFRWVTGKVGMGYGDFKFLGLIGAWLGWQSLPWVILLSGAAGALFSLGLKAIRGDTPKSPALPFGPFLAMAGWVAMLWGDSVMQTSFLLLLVF
ncbi:MAG: A24 family peptidase [Gammaproteobacteria bacterium]|nr:A24 family peptidase [Gammaproteobacteria bacterium]